MQATSAAWKAAHLENILPKSYVEISYKVSDPDAEEDIASVSAPDAITPQTEVDKIISPADKSYNPYVTLELNSWSLDGSMYLPTASQDKGYVGTMSDGNNDIVAQDTISIFFHSTQFNTIPGITIDFSKAFGETAKDFDIEFYNGGSLLNTFSVIDNTEVSPFIAAPMSGYDEIRIVLYKWCLPFHRARIEQVYLGEIIVFGNGDLLGYEHNNSVDLLSFSLPENTIRFTLDNSEGQFNPDNPQGMYQFFLERQQVKIRYGLNVEGGIEWIKGGTFYLTEVDVPQNGISATLSAQDLTAFMQNVFTVTIGTFTLKQLAEQALTQSNVPTLPDGTEMYILDASLSSISVSITATTFDKNVTCGEILQYVANAACCVMYQDYNGILHIEPLIANLTPYVIDQFISYKNAEYNISPQLKAVNINDGMATISANATGEVQEIKNPLIQNAARASAVGTWVKDILVNRKTLSGEIRPDTSVSALDYITVVNKYATQTVMLTDMLLTFNGAFRGNYEGRSM
jgi:hypothetical protein